MNTSKRQSMVALSTSEVLKLLKAAKAHGNREWCAFLLGFKHAMRVSEIANLRMSDIDVRNGQIVVERLKGSLRTTQQLTGHAGQPLLDEYRAIKAWLVERQDDGSDFLFNSQKGGRLTRTQLHRLFAKIAADAGLEASKRHCHCLKHTCASLLVSSGTNVAYTKQVLGHKSINSTMRYVAITDQQASEEAKRAWMKLF